MAVSLRQRDFRTLGSCHVYRGGRVFKRFKAGTGTAAANRGVAGVEPEVSFLIGGMALRSMSTIRNCAAHMASPLRCIREDGL
jgi:hypothetical protein